MNHLSPTPRHRPWVKTSHWVISASFLFLAFTGFEIVMVHPRFYWGEAGNDLTPALFELPVSRNYKHNGWEATKPFFDTAGSPVTASRTYDIFNQNGWGRSLHFLSGWFLVVTGVLYLVAGFVTGHFRKNLNLNQFSPRSLLHDIRSHFRGEIPPATGGPDYGLLQRIAYLSVIFILFPIIIVSGMTMSPAITAAYPWLLSVFFGAQSARTIHFFASMALELFLVIHVVMIVKSGFKKQLRGMTTG